MEKEVTHIVALSGGKDSTSLALRLAEVEPRNYLYVCTPTGNELPEMVDHWVNLGKLLGSPIIPVTNGKGFKATCLGENALPNYRMRFCTRMLKIEPFKRFAYAHAPAILYVGLRADEEERQGANYGKGGNDAIYGAVSDVTQRYPLREWEWGEAEVWSYLNERGIRIPKRTDCAFCFWQRTREWWTLWKEYPALYAEAEAMEEDFEATFRTPGKEKNWPHGLKELREEFEKGRIPKERWNAGRSGQLPLFSFERKEMCRVCSM